MVIMLVAVAVVTAHLELLVLVDLAVVVMVSMVP